MIPTLLAKLGRDFIKNFSLQGEIKNYLGKKWVSNLILCLRLLAIIMF